VTVATTSPAAKMKQSYLSPAEVRSPPERNSHYTPKTIINHFQQIVSAMHEQLRPQ
jgi:hypothetical protein